MEHSRSSWKKNVTLQTLSASEERFPPSMEVTKRNVSVLVR